MTRYTSTRLPLTTQAAALASRTLSYCECSPAGIDAISAFAIRCLVTVAVAYQLAINMVAEYLGAVLSVACGQSPPLPSRRNEEETYPPITSVVVANRLDRYTSPEAIPSYLLHDGAEYSPCYSIANDNPYTPESDPCPISPEQATVNGRVYAGLPSAEEMQAEADAAAVLLAESFDGWNYPAIDPDLLGVRQCAAAVLARAFPSPTETDLDAMAEMAAPIPQPEIMPSVAQETDPAAAPITPRKRLAKGTDPRIATAREMLATGRSKRSVAKELGIAESTLRTWLK